MNSMLSRLYRKNELSFALMWICAYCVANSLVTAFSETMSINYAAASAVNLVLSALLIMWLHSEGLFKKYGLCRTHVPAARFMYYVPLVLLMSQNLWKGVAVNMPVADTLCFVLNMALVGLLEEVIFRGLLFKALAVRGVRSAIIIVSVTFGIGHILNLFNGSGMTLMANLFQIFMAAAWGLLFVVIFYRSGSILPCIMAHSVNNALSAFANTSAVTLGVQLALSATSMAIALGYAIWLWRRIPGESVGR